LENFILINKLAAQKIIDAYARHFPADLTIIQDLNKHLSEFNEIINLEENLKNEILKFYANQFFGGDVKIAEKEFEKRHSESVQDYTVVFIQLIIIVALLVAFFLLTYLVAPKYYFTIEKINVYFPAFSFSLMVILFFIYIPIIIIILKHYKINYIYLLELDPELIYSPVHFFKVKYKKQLTNFIFI
jgi:hypothetical protein